MKFPCRLCSVELTNQQMLKKHFTLYHPENLQFQCRTCHLEFDDLTEVITHMATHLKTTSQCSLCLQSFSKKELNNHYLTVHPGVDRSVCLICNKKYSDSGSLAKHTMVHTGERPYYCPFCFMSFGLKCSQEVHIRRHTNYRPFKCQHCPKSFFNAGEVRKHERLHTGEKPYKCMICKTSYTMRETLTNHLKTHKKFNMKCHHCPMGFNDPKMFEAHMSTHSGVKPFKCPLCTEMKFHIGSLRRHIISLHTDNLDTNCQICGQFEEDTFSLAQHILTHRTDFVGSNTEWFDNVKNSNKSHLSSKNEIRKHRKRTLKKANKIPRQDSNISGNNVTKKSHKAENCENSYENCENAATYDSDSNVAETVCGSLTNNQKKKKVQQRKRKFNKTTSGKKNKNNKSNPAVENFVSSSEENEEQFETSQTLISDTSNDEDNCEHNGVKSEIKEEEDEDDDDYDEPIEGIQEVEAPEFKFQPLKKELECLLCQECFMSQEELLQHVGVHF